MASQAQGGWFKRRNHTKPASRMLTANGHRVNLRSARDLRALTSAASPISLTDRGQARQERSLRQGWQSDAWLYRDAIPEIRYAVQFLANCAARMRFYPAAYPTEGESDSPEPLKDLTGVPQQLKDACAQAINDLGRGKLAISHLAKALSENVSVAGECWLLGVVDESSGQEGWSIRSVDEIVIRDDRWQMREVPSDPQGLIPWTDLDPDLTVLSRIWTPHPRFKLLADSPLRAMLDDCESLTILRRMIRAQGRSRLAGRGILAIPEEFEIKAPNDQDDDPDADPFMRILTDAMVTPIQNEGVAEAVVPIVIRGPGDQIEKIKHIDFASQFDQHASSVRDELVGIIATGMDLPKEVVTGISDLNHWSAWQVDDNTFRHHVEPHVIACCDSLTGAYLRPYLETNYPELADWSHRVVMWYDPTELVTHPDQTADAMQLHDRLVISNKALLKTAGFTEQDAPNIAEFQVRLLHNMRQWPPNVVAEFLHQLDPTMTIPPITESGTVPGIKPSGVDTGEPTGAPAQLPPPGATAKPAGASEGQPGPPPAERPLPQPPPVTAAGASRDAHERLSRRLANIDRDLRVRLHTAANAAMLRHLERVGNRLRSKVAKDETLRAKIAHKPNELVAATLGRELVAASGINLDGMLGDTWGGLRGQFMQWTHAAQTQALNTAMRLAGISESDPRAVQARQALEVGREQAWTMLEGALNNASQLKLYNPDPNVTPEATLSQLNPETLVESGLIRATLAVVGGADPSAVTVGEDGGAELNGFVGQVGTGVAVGDLISSAGGETDRYRWEHAGTVTDPFEPHEALDGVEFESFDDDQLANHDDFPDNAFLFPGDHKNCTCDVIPLWSFPDAEEAIEEGEQEAE